MWIVYALLSAVFASLTAIFAKIGVKGMDSTLATAIRTIVILILSWGIVFFGGKLGGLKDIGKTSWLFLVLSGLATGASWLFYFKALSVGDVSRVAPIDKLSVVFTLVFATLLLKEPMSLKVLIGTLLILAGCLLIALK